MTKWKYTAKEATKKLTYSAKKAKEKYDKPTPKLWRRTGDTLLAVGGIITLFAPMIGVPWVTAVAGALTIAGKYATNFASED